MTTQSPDSIRTLERRVEVGSLGGVASLWGVPAGFVRGQTPGIVLAHGAGNDMHSPFLEFVHRSLVRRGLLVVRFNFFYTEQGRKAPDRAPKLEAVYRAVLAQLRADPELAPGRLFVGGKSMGGRIAAHLAAAGEDVDGLVFLGYPLHPPRKPERMRAAHLKDVAAPMLFIQGARDALCDLDLLRQVFDTLSAPLALRVIEQGDHSFKVPKRTGRTQEEVWSEIAGWVDDWCRGLGPAAANW